MRSALAALATAAALAGCGGAAAIRSAAATSSTPLTSTNTTIAASISVVPTEQASPQTIQLHRSLQRTLDGLGRHVGALVVDLNTGTVLFSRNAGVARAPASLEKLYTSVALLQMLGPSARLQTTVLGVGHLGAHGVWHGSLYLRGDGDPTFGDGAWDKFFIGGNGPTAAELARRLYALGIRRVTGLLYADASRFDSRLGGPATRNAPDIPDYGGEMSALVFDHGATGFGLGPAAFAAHQVAATMSDIGITVSAARHTAVTPVDALPLAGVSSPPVSVLLKLMDVPSDDLFADLLTKQLGYEALQQGTLAAGTELIRQVLALRYALHPRLFDGSGLDKADRSSPAQIVSLLQQLWPTPFGVILRRALPVVGVSGTVQTIADHTAAQGRCVAKTGTLDYVTNLAGYCSARNGHTLAFALMLDGPSNWQAFGPLGRMVAAVASY